MKRTFLILVSVLAGIFYLSSCIYEFESVSGNGNVTREARELGDFSSLDVSRGLDVYLTFGKPQTIEIEADDNLHDIIRTEVVSGTLRIYQDKNIRNAKAKRIYITVPTIEEIEASSAADVIGENLLNAESFSVSVSSAAEVRIEVNAREVQVEASSSGSVELKGETDELDANASSAGSIDADKLQARYCRVTASSAGNVQVLALEEISANASSAGSIRYKGNPSEKKIDTSSAGSVSER